MGQRCCGSLPTFSNRACEDADQSSQYTSCSCLISFKLTHAPALQPNPPDKRLPGTSEKRQETLRNCLLQKQSPRIPVRNRKGPRQRSPNPQCLPLRQQRTNSPSTGSGKSVWTENQHRRYHTGDFEEGRDASWRERKACTGRTNTS